MTYFGTWLGEERARISANDVDLRGLVSSPSHLTRYTRVYLEATKISLEDARKCIPALDASERDGREGWELAREAFIGELAEALFRFAHMLVAVGCSEKELTDRYQRFVTHAQENTPDATDTALSANSPPEEACSDGDGAGTLCADADEPTGVVEK